MRNGEKFSTDAGNLNEHNKFGDIAAGDEHGPKVEYGCQSVGENPGRKKFSVHIFRATAFFLNYPCRIWHRFSSGYLRPRLAILE